jgi:hypothetical protein
VKRGAARGAFFQPNEINALSAAIQDRLAMFASV